MTSESSTSSSIRFNRLLEVLELALSKSRAKFDIAGAVRECYGDGDDADNAVFQTLLEGVLSSIHTSSTAEMADFLKSKGVEERLIRVEAVIRQLDREAIVEEETSKREKEATRASVNELKLPDGLLPQQLTHYQSYQRLSTEKEKMRSAIEKVESEIAELEKLAKTKRELVIMRHDEIKSIAKSMEMSADLCSSLS